VLRSLKNHSADLIGVLALSEKYSKDVSGFVPLAKVADNLGIPHYEFEKINANDVLAVLKEWQPDVIFIVGLSQLVHSEFMSIPTIGCVGFHPTCLPKGRGRAPVVWLVLRDLEGAATFFWMDKGADSGPILAQEAFKLSALDYANEATKKIEDTIVKCLNRWLPDFLRGNIQGKAQDEAKATYYGRRYKTDGLIDWKSPSAEICRLVRATSSPYPGAYSFWRDNKAIVWRARVETNEIYSGVVGRILDVNKNSHALVQTGDGAIWLEEVDVPGIKKEELVFRPGQKFGYYPEEEIFKLKAKIIELENRLEKL